MSKPAAKFVQISLSINSAHEDQPHQIVALDDCGDVWAWDNGIGFIQGTPGWRRLPRTRVVGALLAAEKKKGSW